MYIYIKQYSWNFIFIILFPFLFNYAYVLIFFSNSIVLQYVPITIYK